MRDSFAMARSDSVPNRDRTRWLRGAGVVLPRPGACRPAGAHARRMGYILRDGGESPLIWATSSTRGGAERAWPEVRPGVSISAQ